MILGRATRGQPSALASPEQRKSGLPPSSLVLALAFRARDLFLSLPGNLVGLVVLRAIVPGLGPKLVPECQIRLSAGPVHLIRMHRRLRQNGHPLRQHLDESRGHEELLVARSPAMQPDLAGPE